jgi:alpha-beta hydrolase superfamily lysophospholipase
MQSPRPPGYALRMLRALFILLAVCSCSTPRFWARQPSTPDYDSAVLGFQTEAASRAASDPRHAPTLELQGHATDTVVVVLHGLYESPFYVKGLRRNFVARGYNVVTPLMARHWAVPLEDLDNVSFHEWEQQVVADVTRAHALGKRVLLAGHSLGGLLAVHLALNFPELVDGLMLWSPALKETRKVYYAALAGQATNPLFHLDYNHLAGKPPPDPVRVAYYSPVAGHEVAELEEFFAQKFTKNHPDIDLYSAVKVPVFLVQPEVDEEVDLDEVSAFWNGLSGPKARLILPGETHTSTPKDQDDAIPGVQTPNHDFPAMIAALNQFLNVNFP